MPPWKNTGVDTADLEILRNMLKHRVRSGVLLGAALLAALIFLPPAGAMILLALCCGWSLWEFYALLKAGGIPHFRGIGLVGGISLIVATWWAYHQAPGARLYGDVEAIVLFAVAAAVFIRQMFVPALDHALKSMAATLLGVVYVAWLFNFLNKLLLVFGLEEGRWLIFYLALVVKSTDVGAYFVGCRFGGRKFFPTISPAKTWSGVIGGLATGVAFSMAALYFLQPVLSHLDFGWVDALVLGFILSAAGIAGDLIESLLKRASGVKDSGTLIQGMGGILDVVDSLIFAAPFLYIYMRLFVDIIG
ncbi:MAG TPA: phosphatidate cytidylyltransferase [Kiritimatiellia bacterium]|nr:phosphatidate cytidylyltransferase [Kiritimatiellia bacterium]HMO98744.1 phosphatidate cytidylyltransferase [Kiritimatiellia bacterium]HMP95920.1 phosphatidate cytidylyltransferase [Kiritimatiellia bacterium]